MKFLPNVFGSKKNGIVPVVLISLDGWGFAPPSDGNAITQAKTPNMDSYFRDYPHGDLIASGESVGLPAGEVGNSEVGHLTMGVGRVIYQSLKRINISIETGEFYENDAFVKAIYHARENNSAVHFMGLISSGSVHSDKEHLFALLQTAKKHEFSNVFLHLFTDGRDAPPNDGLNVVSEVQSKVDFMKVGKIATISGRYFAMDRDARWERIKKAYDAMTTGAGNKANSAVEAMKNSYANGKTDEFVEPVVILDEGQAHTVKDNDACIYFNFRVDRARELTMAFTLPNFESINAAEYGFQVDEGAYQSTEGVTTFQRQVKLSRLFFVTMTEYQKNLPVQAIAFPPQTNFPQSLPELLSKRGLKQFHLAESEKERMVTYYFRGMSSTPFDGESVLIVPSPKVPTYDTKPEMSAYKIVKEFKKALRKDVYSFFMLNFANPDMVAHSGNVEATIKAIEHVDKAVGEVVSSAVERGGTVLISADHGNAEELLTFPASTFYYTTAKGDVNTDHSSNPVPILIISKVLKGNNQQMLKGTLSDIAPTILAIMNMEKPAVMQGRNLLGEK